MEKLPTKAVIFDLFGVLCETFNQKWLRENVKDQPAVIDELKEIMVGLDIGNKMQSEYFAVAPKAVGKTPAQIEQEMIAGFRAYPNILELASGLRKKYKNALCSNSSGSFVRPLFEKIGHPLDNYFDHVIISSEIGLVKPTPEMFNYCAKKVGADAGECIFVDDTEENITAASAFGMQTYHCKSPAELEKWLTENF